MKTITIVGDTLNKVTDTSEVFKFIAWNDGVPQDMTNRKIKATVANDSGYLFDVDIPSNGEEIDVDFSNKTLKRLTPGNYRIEFNITDTNGDIAVYPSSGAVPFVISNNLRNTEDELVPQVTFDTVLEAVDKKIDEYTHTIAKGDKGDTGATGKPGTNGKNGADGKDGVVDYSKTVNTTGNQSIAGNKTFSNNVDVNHIMKANYFYKHVPKGTTSSKFMEVVDDNLGDNKPYPVGTYYSGYTQGNGVAISGNGLTGIGGGESINSIFDLIVSGGNDTTALPLTTMGDEKLILASDQEIYFLTDQQNAPNYDNNWRFSINGYLDRYDGSAKKWVNVLPNNSGLVAQNSSVVHRTGNETIAGDKAFTGKVKIGDTEMTDTDWVDLKLKTGGSGQLKYRVKNGVVFIQGAALTGFKVGDVVATLPKDYWPIMAAYSVYFVGGDIGNVGVYNDTGQIIKASGPDNVDNKWSFTMSYAMK